MLAGVVDRGSIALLVGVRRHYLWMFGSAVGSGSVILSVDVDQCCR